MRRSPRRPLILKRRKLPIQNEPPETQNQSREPDSKRPSKPASGHNFLDGIQVLDHPSMSDTQVVVVPKTVNLQSVIGALTVKGKESGVQGPKKFILLTGTNEVAAQAEADRLPVSTADGFPVKTAATQKVHDVKSLPGNRALIKDLSCDPLDDSLSNIHWLGKMKSAILEAENRSGKENMKPASAQPQTPGVCADGVRPPYSYMAMIQFAINSRKNGMMTLKEIYTWIEDHFPYYRDVAKPGWKNSIRHNLSLHDMFIRKSSPDGKVSFWMIRPEANRCLTLDQVYKPGCDPAMTPVPVPMLVLPQNRKKILPDVRKTPTSCERRMKPLLPRTDSYLVPIQLPVFLPSSSSTLPTPGLQQKRSAPREAKRVRIAPKVSQSDVGSSPPSVMAEVKAEPADVLVTCDAPRAAPRPPSSGGSRRKQRLVGSVHEEPVLLCPDGSLFDSGVASDASAPPGGVAFDASVLPGDEADASHDRDYCFKTPIKSGSHLTSSTPSKPSPGAAVEPWRVAAPGGRGAQAVLDFSPIRLPGGPPPPSPGSASSSFSNAPFSLLDFPLFNSPPPPLAPSRAPASPSSRSLTEGLVLDTMNDSLSKILVDLSFSGLEDEELGMANISWSELFPQLK